MVQRIDDPAPILADGSKIIEEYIGRVRTDTERYSVAHMIAPPGWTEPFQRPDFDAVTIVVGGRIQIEHDDRKEVVAAGEVVLVGAGERIRYANPFEESAEYWAVCIPAFDPGTVRRES